MSFVPHLEQKELSFTIKVPQFGQLSPTVLLIKLDECPVITILSPREVSVPPIARIKKRGINIKKGSRISIANDSDSYISFAESIIYCVYFITHFTKKT